MFLQDSLSKNSMNRNASGLSPPGRRSTHACSTGEFGVVLIVGGDIPGVTRVASIAIYDEAQALNFNVANKYAFILFIFSFSMLALIYTLNKKPGLWKIR